jgi:O-antigen/teichoic acid export membrane protein
MSRPETDRASRESARSIRNVLTNWGAFLLNAAVAFFLSPIVVNSLGSDAYGAWVLVGSLVGYLGLLEVGVRGAVTKYVATHHASGAHEDASRVTSAAFAFFTGAGVFAIGVCLVVAYGFLPYFEVPEVLRPVAAIVLLLSGFSIALTVVCNVFGGVIVGVQRFDRLNAVSMVVMMLRAVATIAVLELGWGLIGLALVQLGATAIQAVADVLISRSVYPEIQVTRRDWNRGHVKMLLTFGATSTLLHGAAMLSDYSSSLVIGAYLSVGAITPFSIAATLCLYTRQIVSGISYITGPMAGAMEGRQEFDRIRQMLRVGCRFSTLVISPIVAVFVLRGGSFIGLWMGDEYAGPGGATLRVMSLYLFGFASFQVMASTMVGLNRHRGMVPAFLLEAVANILLSLLLVRSYGILGVAWGLTLPRLVNCFVFSPYYARRKAGVPVREFVVDSFARPALAVAPFALLTAWIEARWPAASLLTFALQVLASLPVALLGAWIFAMKPTERRLASSAVLGALGIRAPDAAI